MRKICLWFCLTFLLFFVSFAQAKSLFDPSSLILEITDLALPGINNRYMVELKMDLDQMTFEIINIRETFPFNGCYAGNFLGDDFGHIIFCVKDGEVIYALSVSREESLGASLSGGTVSFTGEVNFSMVGDDIRTNVIGKLTPTGGSGSWYDKTEDYSGTWSVQKIDY